MFWALVGVVVLAATAVSLLVRRRRQRLSRLDYWKIGRGR